MEVSWFSRSKPWLISAHIASFFCPISASHIGSASTTVTPPSSCKVFPISRRGSCYLPMDPILMPWALGATLETGPPPTPTLLPSPALRRGTAAGSWPSPLSTARTKASTPQPASARPTYVHIKKFLVDFSKKKSVIAVP